LVSRRLQLCALSSPTRDVSETDKFLFHMALLNDERHAALRLPATPVFLNIHNCFYGCCAASCDERRQCVIRSSPACQKLRHDRLDSDLYSVLVGKS